MRILVADDNVDAADTLADLLRLNFPCTVLVAYDGVQALRVGLAERPDVAILDIRMPGLDGIGVARGLRSRGAGADSIPHLIAMPGHLGGEQERGEIQTLFHAMYAKPIDLSRLLAALEAYGRIAPTPAPC